MALGKPKRKFEVEEEVEEKKVIIRNDVREIRNVKQLAKIDFDFDSPRMRQAMENLGVSKDECQKK